MADREIRIRLSGDANALVGSIKLTDEQLSKLNNTTKRIDGGAAKFTRTAGDLKNQLFSLRGVVLALTSGALASLYKRTIDNADSIAKTADSLGLTTTAYQEYRYAADRAGIDTGQFATAMASAEKVIGNAKQGTGQLITYLKNYDPVLLSNIQHTHSYGQALDLIFTGMANAKSSTDAAALSAAAFGTTVGVKMVNLTKNGVGSLDQMRQRAHELGIVLDESVLRNAEHAKDQLTDLSYVVSAELTQAMVNLSPAIGNVAYGLEKTAHWANQVLDQFRAIESQSSLKVLGNEMDKAVEKQKELQQELASEKSGPLSHSLIARWLGITPENTQKELSAAEAQLNRIRGPLQEMINQEIGPGVKPFKPQDIIGSSGDLTAAKSLVDGLTKSLRNQADTYGLSSIAALQYRIAQGDVNDALKTMGKDGEAARQTLLQYFNQLKAQTQQSQAADEAQKKLNAEFQEGAQLAQQLLTPQEAYMQQLMHLEGLLADGAIDVQTFYRGWDKAQADFMNSSNGASNQWADAWTSAGNRLAAGIGDTIGQAMFEQKNAADVLSAALKGIAEQFVSSLVEIGVKKLALWVLEKENIAVTTGALVASGVSTAAAWAPAAAAVSLASFGANAAPADAGITATYALTKALSLTGVAHDGLDFVPREGTYLLNRGERVVSPQDNTALTKALTNGKLSGGMQVTVAPVFQVSGVIDGTLMDRVMSKYIPAIRAQAVDAVQKAFNSRGKYGPLDKLMTSQ